MITQDIKCFEFDSQVLRTVTVDGETLFCGKDAATILGYANTKSALARHAKGSARRYPLETAGGTQKFKFITEPDLYRLVTHSKLPTAEKFEHWVFEEVLPSIRKTGAYGVQVTADQILGNIDAYIGVLEAAKTLKQDNERLQIENTAQKQTLEEQAPKVLFAEAVESSSDSILIGELAKMMRGQGIDIGQNRLFEWMRQEGYLCTKGEMQNVPTQRAMDLGLFQIKKTAVMLPNGKTRVVGTPKVTGKGQIYFIDRIKKQALKTA